MLLSSSVLGLGLALAIGTVAAPAAPNEKRADPVLTNCFMCEHAYWQGQCTSRSVNSGVCVKNTENAWLSDISSFGPDEGYYCVVYENNSCHTTAGARRRIDYPGVDNLLDIGWNDRIGSYQCYPVVAGQPTTIPGWNPPPGYRPPVRPVDTPEVSAPEPGHAAESTPPAISAQPSQAPRPVDSAQPLEPARPARPADVVPDKRLPLRRRR